MTPDLIKLPLKSALTQRALLDGIFEREQRPVLVRLVKAEDDGLVFEAIDRKPASLSTWVKATRAYSLTATVLPLLTALAYGRVLGWPTFWLEGISALFGAVLLQLGVNLLNDVEDHLKVIDVPGGFGGAGVIQSGSLSARQVRRAAILFFLLGALCGLPALLAAPFAMGVVALITMIGAVGYSGKPFGFKYVGLGDLSVVLLCGPLLTTGFGLAMFRTFDAGLITLGLAAGLAAVGILHANNMQDVEVDRSRGAVTVASVLGDRMSRVYFALLYLGAYAAWVVASLTIGLPWYAAAVPALSLIPVGKLLLKAVRAKDLNAPAFALLRVEAAQSHMAICGLMMAGLLLALLR